MSRILVLGTRNRKKLGELALLLAPLDLQLQTLADFAESIEVEETGDSFAANAALKATVQAKQIGQWVLGEDSGLAVDALGGAPGIYSARFSGAARPTRKTTPCCSKSSAMFLWTSGRLTTSVRPPCPIRPATCAPRARESAVAESSSSESEAVALATTRCSRSSSAIARSANSRRRLKRCSATAREQCGLSCRRSSHWLAGVSSDAMAIPRRRKQGRRSHASAGNHTNSADVGLMISSGTWARGGSLATAATIAPRSSGSSILARRSAETATGRCSRIGVSTSPG